MSGIGKISLASLFCLALGTPTLAQSGDDFYCGKDVRILIGAGVGGTYGLYTQLATRHMRQHIPGNPNLIMQSMPGAGGLVGLNYSYNVAPKDGTLMHLVHAEVLYETLFTKDAKFNAQNYRWIGRFADADALALATGKSGIRTLEDSKKREVTMGATGIANVFALGPLMLNKIAGTKFKIIGGYKGTSDIHIAMERGELDGAGMTLANAMTLHAAKMKSGDLVPVFAISAKRIPDFPDVPAFTEFAKGPERTLLEIYASAGTIGRALAFPPGVPDNQLRIMREAFRKTLADPAFQDEVKKANVPITPLSGEEIAVEIDRIMKTPPQEIEAARKLHESLLQTK
jgi:tripartite-type tricarboxylate transporter receptor subunit TctC